MKVNKKISSGVEHCVIMLVHVNTHYNAHAEKSWCRGMCVCWLSKLNKHLDDKTTHYINSELLNEGVKKMLCELFSYDDESNKIRTVLHLAKLRNIIQEI